MRYPKNLPVALLLAASLGALGGIPASLTPSAPKTKTAEDYYKIMLAEEKRTRKQKKKK